jgi:outer membrane protein TolC
MSRRLLPALIPVCTALCLAAGVAYAQEGDSAPLSLEEALSTALANNLELVSAKKDPLIAEQQIQVAHAPFDAVAGASAGFSQFDSDEVFTDNISGVSLPSVPSDRTTPVASARLDHLLNYGANYSLVYDYQDPDGTDVRIDSSTGALTSVSTANTAQGFTLEYNQPLLLGLGKEVNMIDLTLARSGLDISREDLRLSAMQTLNGVEDAYWDVLAAREQLRISGLSLDRANDLLELNRKKVEVGTLAPIEITQAEAGVASQEEGVILAETTLENAEDALLRLMAVPDSSPLWDQSLQLTDRPSYEPQDLDLDASIAKGLEHRPEIIVARQQLKDNELSERVARKNTRHQLDLQARISPEAQSDFDQVFQSQAFTSNTTTDTSTTDWSLGLLYRYPLRNRQAKANYAIARLTTEKGIAGIQQAEQTIRVDVRTAVRNVDSGVQRVEAARKNVELQQKKLDAEQKKFENGMSTSFEVLTFQNDLANAELAEIRARLDYIKSLAALESATGTLLEARGMQIAP